MYNHNSRTCIEELIIIFHKQIINSLYHKLVLILTNFMVQHFFKKSRFQIVDFVLLNVIFDLLIDIRGFTSTLNVNSLLAMYL